MCSSDLIYGSIDASVQSVSKADAAPNRAVTGLTSGVIDICTPANSQPRKATNKTIRFERFPAETVGGAGSVFGGSLRIGREDTGSPLTTQPKTQRHPIPASGWP